MREGRPIFYWMTDLTFYVSDGKTIKPIEWSTPQDLTSWDLPLDTGSHEFTEANQKEKAK